MPAVGIFADLTDQTMPLVEFARAVEDRGFSSLFLNEHTHLPVEMPTSHFPAGGPVPERYARFWDPFIALSFVAATTTLTIGTGVSLIGEHDPIQLAHATATLDALSGGRLVLGVGWGWNREEFANHGRSPTARAQVVEEWVAILRALWTEEIASHKGTFVRMSPSRMWPKPVQKPGPPVLLGAPAGKRTFDRIARWADGWITMGGELRDEDVRDFRRAWASVERPGDPMVAVIFNPIPDGPSFSATLERGADLGVDRVLYHVYEGDRTAMLRRLDRAAAEFA